MTASEVTAALRRRPLMLAVIVLLALGAGVLALYRPTGSPLRLEPRITSLGVASKQVVLDGWRSPMLDLKFDSEPLAARTGAFAQVLGSPALVEATARRAGIPAGDITSEGPYSGPASPWNVVAPSEARSNQVTAERRPYRLSFVTRPLLPLVTIHAQAPTTGDAARLAESAFLELRDYLADRTAEFGSPPPRPIVLHDMGPAASGDVSGRIGMTVVVLAFVGVLVLGLLLLLSLEALRLRLPAAGRTTAPS